MSNVMLMQVSISNFYFLDMIEETLFLCCKSVNIYKKLEKYERKNPF